MTILGITLLFLIWTNSPVFAILALIGIFINSAIILILLKINYLALIYLILYVGAICVLFLFVIMLLDLRRYDTKRRGFYLTPFFMGYAIYLGSYLYLYNDMLNIKLAVENVYIDLFSVPETHIIASYLLETPITFLTIILLLLLALIAPIVITSERGKYANKDNIYLHFSRSNPICMVSTQNGNNFLGEVKKKCQLFFIDPNYYHASIVLTVGLSIGGCFIFTVGVKLIYDLCLSSPHDIIQITENENPIIFHKDDVPLQPKPLTQQEISNLAYPENAAYLNQVKVHYNPNVRHPQMIDRAQHSLDLLYDVERLPHNIIDRSYIDNASAQHVTDKYTKKIGFINRNLDIYTTFFSYIMKDFTLNDYLTRENYTGDRANVPEEVHLAYGRAIMDCIGGFYNNFEYSVKPSDIPFNVRKLVLTDYMAMKNNAEYQQHISTVENMESRLKSKIYEHHSFFRPNIEKLSEKATQKLETLKYKELSPQMLQMWQGRTMGEFINYYKN